MNWSALNGEVIEAFRATARIVQLPQDLAEQKLQAMARTSEQLVGYLKSAAPRVVPVFRIERT